MKTIANAGIGPAAKTGTGPQTLVVPAQQRGIITNIFGSSVTGGAITLNLGPTLGTLALGSIAANGRAEIRISEGVAQGDPDFDIILTVPADFVGGMLGFFASGTS
jgi:hypothetical protein